MSIRSYLRLFKKLLTRDPYLIEHASVISCDHNLGQSIFGLAFSALMLQKQDCKLVQVGANTGKSSHDVFHEINRFHLRSLLIEPQADVFDVLSANYAGIDHVVCVNAALAPEKAIRKIYRLSDNANRFQSQGKPFGTGIASFSRDHVLRYFRTHCTPEGMRESPENVICELDVRCETFQSIADANQFETFDILLVDTEGYDFEVMKMVDVGRRSPSLIKFEHKHLTASDRRAAWDYLRKMDFRQFVIDKTGGTVAVRL